ncbi:helix-turn-helix domain-containing protein [Oceanicella sp. SM1341]|uniref:helix-turn-helix domain-containing protein n=1 Tax=Oceanicella sp. SM1341 TaxID=1548889 RepID=UPI000E54D709|nr:helix-turn-helix domain-containing protein [Oceanicella sp. SM1341]
MRDESVIALQGFDSYELRLGDELRGERASLGKSLLDVQRDLKIKAAYIDAIENCDASVFPNRGFIAGYVRAYARYLNLDAEETYRRFCDESGFRGVNSDLAGMSQARRQQNVPGSARSISDEMLRKSRFARPTAPDISFAALSGLGSVLMLALLIGGLGYGGWYLLKDIQRIGFAPIAQVPDVLDEPSAPVAPEGSEIASGAPSATSPRELALTEIYAPRLEAPEIEPRDGPIAAIDPNRIGHFAPRLAGTTAVLPGTVADAGTAVVPVLPEAVVSAVEAAVDAVPDQVALAAPAGVSVYARENAWVRVYLPNGTVLFEKILSPGESYEVPDDLDGPLLRAGNAGAVYLRVGGKVFGPLGRGTGVAKKVSLVANDVQASWPQASLAAIPDTPVAKNAALPASE